MNHESGALVCFKVSIQTVTAHLVQLKLCGIQFQPHDFHQVTIATNASVAMGCPSKYLKHRPPECEADLLLLDPCPLEDI